MKFPKLSVTSGLPESYLETQRQINEMKWRKEKMEEDLKREEALWDNAKFNFDRKKKEFIKFLADSSTYATQATQVTPVTYLNCVIPSPLDSVTCMISICALEV